MKKNLLDSIDEAINNSFNSTITEKNIKEIINNSKKCKKFISNYFNHALKSNVFIFPKIDNDVSKEIRFNHLLISYGLGCLFKDFLHLGNLIENYYSKFAYYGNFLNDFSYYWYLTSMFHDYGYFITNTYDHDINVDDIAEKYNILHNKVIYPKKVIKITNKVKSDLLKIELKTKNKYSKKDIKNYFNYYRDVRGGIGKYEQLEHGIIGGIKFYDNFVDSLFNNVIKTINSNNTIDQCFSDYIKCDNNIVCSESHIHLYNNLAYIIMSHNIWKADIDNDPIYIKYNLNKLLSTNFKKIDKDNHPMLFLLSLVDTIESIKKFCMIDNIRYDGRCKPKASSILEKIFIEVTNIEIKIDYSELVTSKIVDNDIIKDWIKSILNLSNWVDVNVKNSEKKNIINIFPL